MVSAHTWHSWAMALRMSCVGKIGMQLRSVRANEPGGHVDRSSATTTGTPSAIPSLSRKALMDVWSRPPGRRATPCFPMTAVLRRRRLLASGMLCGRKGRRRMAEEVARSRASESPRLPGPTNLGCWRRASGSAEGSNRGPETSRALAMLRFKSVGTGLRDEHG